VIDASAARVVLSHRPERWSASHVGLFHASDRDLVTDAVKTVLARVRRA